MNERRNREMRFSNCTSLIKVTDKGCACALSLFIKVLNLYILISLWHIFVSLAAFIGMLKGGDLYIQV